MAKKKTPITVTITEGKHATQPFTFSIDDVGPGPKVTVRERYTRSTSCKKGALRKLDACTSGGSHGREWNYTGGYAWFTPDGRPILFIVKRKKK